MEEIKTAIRKLKCIKSPGFVKILTELIKRLGTSSWTTFINFSLTREMYYLVICLIYASNR